MFRHDERDRQRFCETTPVPPSGLSGIYKREDITKAAYLKPPIQWFRERQLKSREKTLATPGQLPDIYRKKPPKWRFC